MSDENIQEIEAQEETPHGDEAATTDWKAEARKWEKRAKENKGAAEKLSAIESDNASRISELEERAAKAEEEAENLRKQRELEEMQEAVATKYDLPRDVINFLKGSTAEELDASAAAVKAIIPTALPFKDGGNPSGPEHKPSDKKQFVKQLFSNE